MCREYRSLLQKRAKKVPGTIGEKNIAVVSSFTFGNFHPSNKSYHNIKHNNK